MVEKYLNAEGRVAVLVSPEYGSGWSTWNDHPQLVFDPMVVKWVLDGKPVEERLRIIDYLEATYKGIFIGTGFDTLVVEWLEPKMKFKITDYDGYEGIHIEENENWLEA